MAGTPNYFKTPVLYKMLFMVRHVTDRGTVRADHHTTAGCSAPIEQTSQQSVQSSSSTDSVTSPSGLP